MSLCYKALNTKFMMVKIPPQGYIMKTYLIFTIFLAAISMTIVTYAQKGTGETTGISHQRLTPALVELEGDIQSIESGPCKYTTGKSISGTHLIIKTTDKMLNIHLGPTSEVYDLVAGSEGEYLILTAFRTDKLPENHFIAQELNIQGENLVLRDENLKPMWAGKYGREKRKNGRKN